MSRKLPPLHALAAFESVARHQSFTRAAQELHLTHSAVSHRIRQLEDSLGTRLFLRLNRSVVPTAAGSTFLVTVREVLEKLQVASASLGAEGRSVLRISPAPALASNWLAPRLGDFMARHPAIELEIHSSKQITDLRTSEVDVGIRFGPGGWPGCRATALFTEDTFPVASPAYLRKAGPLRKPADLKKATLLRTPFMPWQPWFAAAGLDWPEPVKGPLFKDVLLLQEACASGAGVALAGSVIGAAAVASGRVKRLFPISAPAPHPYWAVCLEEKRARPQVAAFMDWVCTQPVG